MQVFHRKVDRRLQCSIGKLDIVICFIFMLYPFEDGKGISNTRFFHIDLCKTAAQCLVFVKKVSELLIGRGTNTLEITPCQCRFEQIGSIHASAACCPRSDHCMYLIDKKNRIIHAAQFFNDSLKTFFKITAVFRSCDQRTHIQSENFGIFQYFGDFSFGNFQSQTFCNSCFSDTRLPYKKRVVLLSAAKCLHDTFYLIGTSDHRVYLSGPGQSYQFNGELFEHRFLFFRFLGFCCYLFMAVAYDFKDIHT